MSGYVPILMGFYRMVISVGGWVFSMDGTRGRSVEVPIRKGAYLVKSKLWFQFQLARRDNVEMIAI